MRIESAKAEIVDVDMTPMIDIVFQLIAFFMVITNFEQTQADERVKLPRDMLAKPPEYKLDHELVVNIGYNRDKEGKALSDALILWPDGNYALPDFRKKLEQEDRVYNTKGIDTADVTVIIRADAEVPTGLVQELIQMCQEIKFQKFAMKATQKVE